tara:strand:- start:1670 stop:2017 length:348 start_codon:yes stop_codon:yes gene_type:complete
VLILSILKKVILKSIIIFAVIYITISNSYSNLNSLTCENIDTKNKINIIYSANFAKEEMLPNIWLFFQKVNINENYISLISLDDNKPIREWEIDKLSGNSTLTPLFDPPSQWICK